MTSQQSSKSTKGARTMAELMAAHNSGVRSIKKGDEVEGVVKKLTPKEILLDIDSKGDALVLEFDKRNLENLLSFLKVGDRVKAVVLSPESEEGFPVVSLRRTLDNLIYSKFEELTKSNKPLTVHISDGARGGYFAVTNEGIRGFLPNSQLLEEESGDIIGKSLSVQIIEFDRDKKRVIFSQKATQYLLDPEEIGKLIKAGDTVKGRITSVTPYGLYVVIEPKKGVQIEGFIHISEISYDRIESLSALYNKGEEITAEVRELDQENRRVNLSIKKLQKDTFEDLKEKYKVEQRVKATVTDIKSKGVTLEIEKGVNGFIAASKIPSGKTYEVGQSIEVEIEDFDTKRRLIMVSPVLKAIPIGYR